MGLFNVVSVAVTSVTMASRLPLLEKLVASGSADSFTRYAFAMELRKEGLVERSLAAFTELRALDAQYVPSYLMAAQLLQEVGRSAEARQWAEAGVEVARAQGDGRAVSELGELLAQL